MSDTLGNIQTRVRWEARDGEFNLTNTSGLEIANNTYRRLAAIIPWPELNREDTSASTTAGQESVTWPSVKYIDVTQIELQDPDNNNQYATVVPARSELEWAQYRRMESDFPVVYKRTHDGTQNVVKLAPTPLIGSLTLRITGQIEPTEFSDSASTTIFISELPDDILALMISSQIMDKRNQPARAKELLGRAAELLSAIAGREITPSELRVEPNG